MPDLVAPPESPSRSGIAAQIAQVAFLSFALVLFFLLQGQPEFDTLSITLDSIVLEAFPFMLLGSLIGGLIEIYLPRERLTALLPRQRLVTVFVAAGLGMLFPVCECAIVPVVRRLLRKGMPLGAAVAYLLGGPIVNPLVAASTAVAYAFSWKVVLVRLLCGYLVAAGVAILMDLLLGARAVLPAETGEGREAGCSCHGHGHGHDSAHAHGHESDDHAHDCGCGVQGASAGQGSRLAAAVQHAADDFFDIARFLVMGAFVAALMQTLVTRRAFLEVLQSPSAAIVFMMWLAILLNLCSEADAFVAASFRPTGMPLSAQMAFMVLGPMLDIKLLLMYTRLFRQRAILLLAGLTFTSVLLAMTILEHVSR